MKSTSLDRDELISICKIQYKRNTIELKNIDEFEQNYSQDNALSWYTKPSFLHQVLNKALRIQNIDLLFLFRFFIRDLAEQLQQYRCLSPVRIYRGQRISNEELKTMQHAIGQFISINSFFSTTTNREVALFFLGDFAISNCYQRILFEIDADPCIDGVKSFANISLFSHFPDEEEILMMIGSIFQLTDIFCENNQTWIVRMKLCSENDHHLKSINDYMKKEYSDSEEISFGQFGNVLRCMGKYDDAEKYYRRLLNALPYDHRDVADCYWGLGITAFDQGQYDLSLKWHRKAQKIFQQTLEWNDHNLGDTHNCIGSAYERKGNFRQALKSYRKALDIYQQTPDKDHDYIAMCFSNIGNIYQEQKKYSKALVYHRRTLMIWEKSLPADHYHLGSLHNNIANVYYSLRQYNFALKHYNQSINIKSRSLPCEHPSIASTFKNLGDVYENLGQFQQALIYFGKSANIYHRTLPSTHPYVIGIKKDIRRVSVQRR